MSRHALLLVLTVFCSSPVLGQLSEVCVVRAKAAGGWNLRCDLTSAKDGTPSIIDSDFSLPISAGLTLCPNIAPTTKQQMPLDATVLSKLLNGLPNSKTVISPSGNSILLVSSAPPIPPAATKPLQLKDLEELNRAMLRLLKSVPENPATFAVAITVPHASALGSISNLAAQVSIYSKVFTATPSGKDRLLITTNGGLPATCDDWTAFLDDMKGLVWSVRPESSEARLTELDAASTATPLGGTGASSTTPAVSPATGPGSAGPGTGGNGASPPQSASPPALTITVTPSTNSSPSKGTGAAPASTGATTISVSAAPSTPPTPAPAAPAPAVASAPTPGVSVGSISPDLLVLTDTVPGDDSAITEKKRLVAVLDLPRAEMSISGWVMQNSSGDPRSVNEASRLARTEVGDYNSGLEGTIFRGWSSLKTASANDNYYAQPFYDYVARRVIFDGHDSKRQPVPQSNRRIAEDFLKENNAPSQSDPDTPGKADNGTPEGLRRKHLGACSQFEYCLGYTTLFHPLKPRLMDLLLALIASADPVTQIQNSIDTAECRPGHDSGCQSLTESPLDGNSITPEDIWKELFPLRNKKAGLKNNIPTEADFSKFSDCEEADYVGTLRSISKYDGKPVMYLNCFRRKATTLLSKPHADADSPSELGLIRAAVADFLFNYKMSQQYPHEFAPYDLTTSSQAMNSALRPLVDAFLRDVVAYQAVLKRKLGLEIELMNRQLTRGTVFDKPRLFNNAIVTVSTLADSEGNVDTSTESYLEALNLPSLSSVASAVMGTAGTSGTTTNTVTGGTALNGLLSGARLNEAQAIAAGINQFQSSHIHLGRELAIDVKPQSLLGANAAELQVSLKADDEAGTGTYSSGSTQGSDAEVSRLSKSDTTTKVRVDSLKLFEVSSFASELSSPKKRVPILPVPFLEMPYFGSLLSLPLPPAREYHSSIAVISATVIPNAADLAFTARFVADRILARAFDGFDTSVGIQKQCAWPNDSGPVLAKLPLCKTRPMVSLHDFNGQPVREYNRMMTQCLATDGKSPIANLQPLGTSDNINTCKALGFKDVLGDTD